MSTQALECKPVKDISADLSSINGTARGLFNNGTLTIKKIISTTKKLIPDASYIITPNPHTLQTSLLVDDNDKNDFNRTKASSC